MATKRNPKKTRSTKKTTKKKRSSNRPSKSPPKRATKAAKSSASTRRSKKPPKAVETADGAATTNGTAQKRKSARKRSSKAPSKPGAKRTTRPAKVRAGKKKTAAPRFAPVPDTVTVTAEVPPRSATPNPPVATTPIAGPGEPAPRSERGPASGSRTGSRESYLEGVPQDHAELLAEFLKVVKAAAGDIRKLVLQAIALSNQKRNRFDR